MRKAIVLGLAVLFLAAVAPAADRDYYFALKPGMIDINEPGVDSALGTCLELGYKLGEFDQGFFALQGEFVTTISDGDVPGGSWDGHSLGLFGVYKSSGDLYFLGKAGYVDTSVDVQLRNGLSSSGDDDGAAAGLGGGWKVSDNVTLEIGWTRMLLDVDVDMYSFGVVF